MMPRERKGLQRGAATKLKQMPTPTMSSRDKDQGANNFQSDFILYANKINSSKGSHLPAGHRKPSAHFLCRLRRRKVSQYQSATLETAPRARGPPVLNLAIFLTPSLKRFTSSTTCTLRINFTNIEPDELLCAFIRFP